MRALKLLATFVAAAHAAKAKYDVQPGQDTVDDQDGQLKVASFPKNTDNFVIGGVFALSNNGTGTANLQGMQRAIAFECAVNRVNSEAISGSTTFYYNIQDDGNSVPFAVRAAANAVEGGIPALVGPESSDQMLSSAPVYSAYGLPIMGPASTSNALSDSVNYPSFFRMVPGDAAQAQAIAAACVYFNWSLITPIYTTDAYGSSGALAFTAAANANRISFTCGRTIPPGTTAGITNTNDCLASSFSNVVLLYMSANDASNVITALYNSTSNSRLTFLASDAWAEILDFRAFSRGRFPASFLEGTLGFLPQPGDREPYVQCASGYTPDNNDLPYFNQFWEETFHCVLNADSQLPDCPQGRNYRERNVNAKECKCNGEENLSQAKVAYVYDSVTALASALNLIQTDCGSLQGIDFCDSENITGQDLVPAISQNTFQGLTGFVRFIGNDRIDQNFTINQYREDGSLVLVGHVNSTGNATIDNNLLIFKTTKKNSTTQALEDDGIVNAQSQYTQPAVPGAPISKIVPQQIELSDPVGAVFMSFVFLGMVICICFHVYFFIHRKEKVIRKTSPVFNQLILFGIDLVFISQIFWVVQQTTTSCILKVWFFCIGFGLIMGNLLAKTWRIYKIFRNVSVTSLVIRDTDLLIFSGVVVLGEVILLCIYCFVSGLVRPVVLQSKSDSLLQYVQCRAPSSSIQLGLLIALFAYNVILVVAGVIIAYLTRNVDSAFNESKYIGFTMYVYLLSAIILTPLYYTAGDSQSSISRQFILRIIGVVLSMYFSLFALFVPKIIAVEKEKRARKQATHRDQESTATHRVTEISSTNRPDDSATGGPAFVGRTSGRTSGQSSGQSSGMSSRSESSVTRRVNSRSEL